jgi:HTH-type transcriptional regulator/antitoxin MqsA
MTIPVGHGKRSVDVTGDFSRCERCGESFHPPGEMNAILRAAAIKIRAADGLLTPSEIRAIRLGLGLTQAAFERMLGVGEKTVVRWERGTIPQSAATDTLLRVIRDVPQAAAYLRRQRTEDRKRK